MPVRKLVANVFTTFFVLMAVAKLPEFYQVDRGTTEKVLVGAVTLFLVIGVVMMWAMAVWRYKRK